MNNLLIKDKIFKCVHIIATGGTIEKIYNERDGRLSNRRSIIKSAIERHLRLPHTEVKVYPLLNKDSLEMTDKDRLLVVQTITDLASRFQEPIVVLHGTDTMETTAKFCSDYLADRLTVPVVLTGAMKPLGFIDTDAIQNVTEALLAVKLVKPGIYLSFHGELFSGSQVSKNHQRGTFELPPTHKAIKEVSEESVQMSQFTDFCCQVSSFNCGKIRRIE